MDRRRFLLSPLAGVLAGPLAAEAQQAGKVYRIGVLHAAAPSDPVFQRLFGAFRAALAELDYVEGKNIAIEVRWAAGKYERLPSLAAELVRIISSDNIARCCIGCNASKGTKSLVEWLGSRYCPGRGITRDSVTEVVRLALDSNDVRSPAAGAGGSGD